jgi:ATP-dependent Clp protease ATP-binding subunit ClpA
VLTNELQSTLNRALEAAFTRRHEYLTLEHVLYAMLDERTASRVLRECGASVDRLRTELENYFDVQLEAMPEGEVESPEQTPGFQRVLQNAVTQARNSGQSLIDGGHVLAAIFTEPHSTARHLLEAQGMTRLDVLRYLSHGISKGRNLPAPRPSAPGAETEEEGEDRVVDPLEAWTEDLVARAAAGGVDPLIGRENEVMRTIQVLCRRRKNNPIFVGDPGVGKTAIAEGLALRIHRGEVPDVLRGVGVRALDLGSLLAGAKYRGEFEERLKSVLARLKDEPGTILFIDEIHTLVGAGAVSGGAMDASNILKPALAAGQLRCIGSTTYQEYKSAFERDRALARRFQRIEISEPSVEDTIRILDGLKRHYEAHHEVRYTSAALVAAAELSAKHLTDRFLPDKAIDVVDEAGAATKLLPVKKRPKSISVKDIEIVVARMAKIPPRSVSASDRDRLASLETDLKAVIFGQDHAVEQLVRVIKLSRSGLGQPGKPIGSFLFSGPTGVGKTELAKQLAVSLGVEFLRFDMSEYMEKHTVSRLIGAPPGYVGFDQGGLLTDAIVRTPYAVLVLDEIEKAHPDVFNILLQVMDHATLTDNNGKKADFRNVVFIMTTNAGARDLSVEGPGFRSGSGGSRSRGAIERAFSPEFRNRLDAWIAFGQLSFPTIERVVDKFVDELRIQLAERKVTIELTQAARAWMATKGYDPAFGARPMSRLVREKLREPLAELLLFGPLAHGGSALVDVEGDGITIRVL